MKLFKVIVCLACLIGTVLSAPTRRKKKIKAGLKNIGSKPQEESMMKALYIIKNTYLLAFAPVVLLFLYSVITDPAAPFIVRELWKRLKRTMLSNLTDRHTESEAPELVEERPARRRRHRRSDLFKSR